MDVMFGRTLPVLRGNLSKGAARFRFEDLCRGPLGASDYIALLASYRHVFVTGLPALSMNERDQARRFITLVDEVYNAKGLLTCTAAGAPDELFGGRLGEEPILNLEALQFESEADGGKLRRDVTVAGGVAPVAGGAGEAARALVALGGNEEMFAFRRAVSRILEMGTAKYAREAAAAAQLQAESELADELLEA